MKIVLLGSSGMLGSYIKKSASFSDVDLISISRNTNEDFDFINPNKVISLINFYNPDVVINCVAITSFAACENDFETALAVNCNTPAKIADYCESMKIKFVHISTDHFFNNDGKYPHSEEDKVEIVNSYAKSKYLAENKILKKKSSLVLRTSIIGRTEQGRTFLDWIINAIKNNERVGLFYDAHTSFIHCSQLSMLIYSLIESGASGLLNVGCREVFSKEEFCLKLAAKMNIEINSYSSSAKILETPRAVSCGLSSYKIEHEYNLIPPTLNDVLNFCIEEDSGGLHETS